MKRYSIIVAVFVLFLMAGSIAFANFPSLTPSDSTTTVYLKQGYYQDSQVWFFCTDSNDINFASTLQYPYRVPTLSKPMESMYDPTLTPTGSKMFFNLSVKQGPVFTAVPTQANYSGIWSVVFIKFKTGQERLVTNTNPWNAITNPTGFPTLAQADFLSTYGTSQSGVVVDCPIAAVGIFPSGLWPSNNSNPTKLYRLPQVITFNRNLKTITLPTWNVYCQERLPEAQPGAFYIDKCTVIVPDVQDPILAGRLKANLAPGLGLIDPLNVQEFYFIDGRIFGVAPPVPFLLGGPTGILAAINQYPVIQWDPNGIGAQNSNNAYTPVMNFSILEGGPNYPYTPTMRKIIFVNNAPYIEDILLPGLIFMQVPDLRINSPVLGVTRIRVPVAGCPDC